jgi:4-hydroxybenzoate polyprenyltransferase
MKASGVLSLLRSSETLGRAAGLLTVWSNCLAGWWLGGGGNLGKLPVLFAAATLLYVGGTLVNEAFDLEFGWRHPQTQPVPSGAIAGKAGRGWGLAALALGAVGLFWLGKVTGGLGLALLFCIVLCDVRHRLAALSAGLPGVCRFFVCVIGASTGTSGVTSWSIWCGLALAVYVAGVSCVARQANRAGPARHWPILLLAVPIVLALIMDDGGRREAGLLLSAVLALWTIRCLRPALWSAERDFAGAVPGLVAGIVLVDLLAAAGAPREISFVFLLLFGVTRLLQRPSAGRVA